MPATNEPIQYLVIRADLGMSPGKVAVQAAHASSACTLPFFGQRTDLLSNPERLEAYKADFEAWAAGSFAKLACMVADRQELDRLRGYLDQKGVPYVLVRDQCRTELVAEEEDGCTPTCLGVVPMARGRVPGRLAWLPLFRALG